ncbi:SIR2 family protein [Flavobacterium luteolum]|uniref:SIR2 family protein n=1 Tax=Flavobacterium luteolum TaxID=3003259 RepID=UPI00248DAFB5|nr:SIR2 family protein [Flavobacterium luteolum]
MASKRIFELIRKEEVVLFAGAGMSRYAGFPSGGELADILHKNLSDDIKGDVEHTWNLPKLCEDIFLLQGNKSYLIDTLKQEFKKKPKTTETHKLLAGIPHFRTIITTNYDTLIELENDRIEVIRTSIDYASAKKDEQMLFKIHSDFSDIENIILTSSDYLNYFTQQSESTVFWNAVKDRLASNHILFIGYSLDDLNVQDMIKKIISQLGDYKKEMYFVAPSLDRVKQAFLQKHNIKHIQSTGEDLIKEIDEDIRQNFLPDLAKGIGKADTALSFANARHLGIELKKGETGIDIGNVKSLDENSAYHIDLKLKLEGDKKDQFFKFINNKTFDEINLEGEVLQELSFMMKDLRIRNEESISRMTLQKRPAFNCKINIAFEDDFEVDDYPFTLSAISPEVNESHLKIVANGFTLLIKLKFDPINDQNRFNMEVIPPDNIKSTNIGLDFYKILSRITSNLKFKIFREGKLFFASEQFPLPFTKDAFEADAFLDYFSNLKKIEKFFNKKFLDINLQNANKEGVNLLLAKADNKALMYDFKGVRVTAIDANELEVLKCIGNSEQALVFADKKETAVKLHGEEFDLEFIQDIIEEPVILNPEVFENYNNEDIIIGSKTNKIIRRFSKDRLDPS